MSENIESGSTHQIDTSRFKASLSPEIVTEGEIQAIFDQADAILRTSSVRTEINGIPAIASEQYMPDNVDGTPYYLRVFRYLSPEMQRTKIDSSTPFQGLVFDDDPDILIRSPNPRAIRYDRSIGRPMIIVDTETEPRVNDPVDVRYVEKAQNEIVRRMQMAEFKKVELAQKELEESQKERAEHWAHRYRRIKHAMRVTGKFVGITAAVGLVGGAGFVGCRALLNYEPYDYDSDPGVEVPDQSTATVLSIGDADSAPAFLEDFMSNKKLLRGAVTVVDSDDSHYDTSLGPDDVLREVILRSSEPGKNCANVDVADGMGLGSKVLAWTDFIDENGKPRNNELSVKYGSGFVKVCFIGQEKDDNDDPRVILKLIPDKSVQAG